MAAAERAEVGETEDLDRVQFGRSLWTEQRWPILGRVRTQFTLCLGKVTLLAALEPGREGRGENRSVLRSDVPQRLRVDWGCAVWCETDPRVRSLTR